MARTTAQTWIQAGFEILAAEGATGLTIDGLCQKLSITKGSFYHHFSSLADYKTQLLAFWEAFGTQEVIQHVELAERPLTKISRLLDITLGAYRETEVALRAWALQDAEVRSVQQRIDQTRLSYVQGLLGEALAKPAEGQRVGLLFYALFIGAQQLMPPLDSATLHALFDEFKQLYHLEE